MKRIRVLAVIVGLLLIGSTVLGVTSTDTPASVPTSILAFSGALPPLVHQAGPQAVDAYSAALKSPDVLRAVPCTCGCVDLLGHENNLDCYVDKSHSEDTVSLSTHGLYCYVCQVITRDAVAGAAAGMTEGELRRMILDRYYHGS